MCHYEKKVKATTMRSLYVSLVSRPIVLMRTNVISLLNRVPERDCLTFLVIPRTKCK